MIVPVAILLLGAAPVVPGDRCGELRLTIVDDAGGGAPAGGDAQLELGHLSAASQRGGIHRGAQVVRRIRLKVEGCATARFARVRAALRDGDGRSEIRIDGARLSAAPRLVDAAAPLGRFVLHTLEISIPTTEPAGPLAAEIAWTAEVD
jgi:hypothetical protein